MNASHIHLARLRKVEQAARDIREAHAVMAEKTKFWLAVAGSLLLVVVIVITAPDSSDKCLPGAQGSVCR